MNVLLIGLVLLFTFRPDLVDKFKQVIPLIPTITTLSSETTGSSSPNLVTETDSGAFAPSPPTVK